MNKKMLLVTLLIPFAAQAMDGRGRYNAAHGVASQGRNFVAAFLFGNENGQSTHESATREQYPVRAKKAFVKEILLKHAEQIASNLDERFVGKNLVNVKGISFSTGDIARFAAALAVRCGVDKHFGHYAGFRTSVTNHAATMLLVDALKAAYGKISAVAGLDPVNLDAATNEVLGHQFGEWANRVLKTLFNQLSYDMVYAAVAHRAPHHTNNRAHADHPRSSSANAGASHHSRSSSADADEDGEGE